MKIYTKTGDAGETSFFDNSRVSKADARVDAYGEVDELNATLAKADALAPSPEPERGTAAEQRQRIVGARREATVPMEDLAETLRVIGDWTARAEGED